MFLMIKTGSTIPALACNYGDFEEWMIRFMAVMHQSVNTVDVQKGGELPEPDGLDGILITGSHAMVTDKEDWSEKTAEWLRNAVQKDVPILGICYGHQLLAHALGGIVGNHPKGPEIGTVDIKLTDDAKKDRLFSSMPQSFKAHVTHTQSALTLPEGATLLAYNDYEPHHAFRYGKCVWGVQFHPEFDALVSREYAILQKDKLKDPDAVIGTIEETLTANTLLEKFVDVCIK